jgi:hypothetical protein
MGSVLCCISKEEASAEPASMSMDLKLQLYRGAGCMFSNGSLALAGFDPRKQNLSGLGGKREPQDANYYETAWRETLEELFGEDHEISKIPKLPPRHVTFNEKYQYVILHYTFHDLEVVLKSQTRKFHSRLYEKRPQSIADLLMSRKIIEHCEIAQLSLLPVAEKVIIASEYVEDLRELM